MMANTKRRKRRERRVQHVKLNKKPIAKAREAKSDDVAFALRIIQINKWVALTAVLPVIYISFNLRRLFHVAPKLLFFCILTSLFILALKRTFQRSIAETYADLTLMDSAKWLRFFSVGLLSTSIFTTIIFIIPILYVGGYIGRIVQMLPTWGQVGDRLSVTLTFLLGAAVSGVLGNFLYDILKTWFLKRKA